MDKVKTYKLLQKLHKSKLDELSVKVSQTQDYLNKESESVKLLENYLDEYRRSFNESISYKNKTLLSITSYNAFMKKLNSMLDEQRIKISTITERLESLRCSWRGEHVNYNKYEKLIQSITDNEEKELNKLDRKYTDEISVDAHLRNIKKH